jgi:hypothetical protein
MMRMALQSHAPVCLPDYPVFDVFLIDGISNTERQWRPRRLLRKIDKRWPAAPIIKRRNLHAGKPAGEQMMDYLIDARIAHTITDFPLPVCHEPYYPLPSY